MEIQQEPASAEYFVIAYSDGSCIPNPGNGGHAFVAELPDGRKYEYQCHVQQTTNAVQEMMGVAAFLRWIHPDQPATLLMDSQFIVDGCNGGLAKWKANSWRRAGGGSIANSDLWKQIDGLLAERPKVQVAKVKAHAKIAGDERADAIAKEAARNWGLSEEGQLREVQA